MKRFLGAVLAAALLVAVAGTATARDHVLTYTFDGDAAGDRLGHGVSGAGDVNADGYDDIIVGAYYGNGSRPGYARVYSGKDGSILYTFRGDSNYDGFGVSVNGAGDVNADGYDDVIVGAYLADPNGSESGFARVFSGKDGSILYTFNGNSSGDRMGLTANGAGDVNADGYDDLIVGAYLDDSNGTDSGTVYVFSGKDGSWLHYWKGNSAGDNYGVYVGSVGDVDKDGYSDLVVGAHYDDPNGSNSGSVEVYSGKSGTRLFRFTGNSSDDRFGRCAEGAGDVNADGYPDIVVGAFYDDSKGSNSGTVYVYSGKDGSQLYRWTGDAADDRLGVHVEGLGDVNGDGYADVAAGAYCDDDSGGSNCGSARVFSGKDGSILYTWYGSSTNEYLGRFIASAGDVNGDGLGDIVVSAYCADYNGTDSGRVYVYVSPVPSGTLTIENGAEATNETTVDLALTWKSAPGGGAVTDMRFRDEGETWGEWTSVSPTATWTLPPGEGLKTIEVQFIDEDGATSRAVDDSIVLDQTPPMGAVTINHGYPATTTRTAELQLEFSDVLSSVESMRFRNETAPWSYWRPAAPDASWTLSSGGGTKTVEAQFRDLAGNLSDPVSDTIEFYADLVPPEIDSVRVNDGVGYGLPGETIEFEVYCRDNIGGSGMDAIKISCDAKKTWSPWYTLQYGPVVPVDHPGTSGLTTAVIVARDRALNESAEVQTVLYLLEDSLPDLAAGAKFAGGIARAEDVDGMELTLVEGDLLTVKVKAKSMAKGRSLDLDLDLLGPTLETIVEGRYPEDTPKPGIASFPIPATGRYLLVVRRNIFSEASYGTYKLKAKVKQARENKKGKGEFTVTEIPFDAAAGSTFKASLKADGLEPGDVTLVGPEGEVAFEAKGRTGSVKIGPVTLDAGTGTYAIRFAAEVAVKAKWRVKLPRLKGTVAE